MPRPYPDSAKRENFCGGWDFQKAQLRERLIFPDLKRRVVAEAEWHAADAVLSTDPTEYKVVARASAPAAELPSDRPDTEKGPANPT